MIAKPISVSAPLEAGWRSGSDGDYFVVLNPTPDTKNGVSITLTGVDQATTASVYDESRSLPIVGGALTDSFGPYSVHIYQVQ